MEPLFEALEGQAWGAGMGRPRGFAVDRAQRVPGEEILQVGEDQLLVLLLVLEADLDEAGERRGDSLVQQGEHMAVDMGPVGPYLVEPRPGDQTALGPRVLRPEGVVVGI